MSSAIGLDTLVAALRSAFAGGASVPLVASGRDVAAARLIAQQNKVLSFVQSWLAAPAGDSRDLAQAAVTLQANSVLLEELRALAPRLATAGIPFIAIKGPVQQKLLHGDVFQRPAADLDLLVRPRDYARAKAALLSYGYENRTPSVWWRGTLGEEHLRRSAPPHVMVDLHSRVHQPGAPALLDGEILFDGLVEVDVHGTKVPTLNAPNGLLLCTISIAKALYNREPAGAHMCDLYAGLMAAAPNAVNDFFTMARRAGLGGHAAVALRLVRLVFDLDQDVPAGAAAFGDVPDEQLLRMVFLPRDRETVWLRRRAILWALCERRPGRYGIELGRIVCSEITRRVFERPLSA